MTRILCNFVCPDQRNQKDTMHLEFDTIAHNIMMTTFGIFSNYPAKLAAGLASAGRTCPS